MIELFMRMKPCQQSRIRVDRFCCNPMTRLQKGNRVDRKTDAGYTVAGTIVKLLAGAGIKNGSSGPGSLVLSA